MHNRSLRLVINVTALEGELTGIGHYVRHLTSGLLRDDRVSDIVGFGHARWYDRSGVAALVNEAPGAAASRAVTGVLRPLARHVPGARRVHSASRAVYARAIQARTRGYTYWEPNYVLGPRSDRAFPTVHDLSHLAFPEHHPADRIAWLHRGLKRSIERARHILTVSEFTRTELVNRLGVREDRISIVSPGVSRSFFQARGGIDSGPVRRRYDLPANYILAPMTLEPRKNLARLIRAHRRLPDPLRRHFPLVVTGSLGWGARAARRQLSEAVASGDARHLGYIPRTDLPHVFASAALVAYPSLYEGFGMPVVEAMAAGTPVLTSNCASMPEAASGAALLVRPTDVRDIRDGLQSLLEDPGRRHRMVHEGTAVAGRWTWERSTNALFEALLN